ncbi:MAG: serine/threonine protein kinase [Polyangiaceae bacterium]|nr:serine/threonine protein kinase [Polyangiaceae bacterium]MCE7893890.1 serine/threonine protein kinase [Sorangiineae bacterium PRO1]MCL4751675.1 serine/threonine protein kinase [Myxococcales bacterium]
MTSPPDDRPTALDSPLGGVLPEAEGELSDDLVGVTLQNTYRLERVIGEGGMGRVYEAHHTRIAGKRFAVKVIRAEMAGSPEVRARFHREADAAASISHPNVVAVQDFGYAEDGRPYLVCEYLEGKNLGDVIKERGMLPLELAAHLARKVAQGVAAAHAQGVIHRDLKPDNVHLIGSPERPEVKVLDFGLSRFIEASGNSVTRTGIAMGTPSFMAPEQARGERVDQRADVYGVGAIIYNCLTGRPPFAEESVQQTMLAVMTGEPTRPRLVNPDIPEELELVVQRAMASDPAERYQTMEELEVALSHFDAPRGEEPNRPPRRQLLSRTGSLTEDSDVGSARPQVLLLAVLGLLAGLLGLITTVHGLPELLGRRALSASEFWLVLAVVVGTLLTPGVLTARWFWRRYWNNSVKMLELLPRLRGPVVGAIASYGLVVLLGRTADAVAQHAWGSGAFSYSGWAGFGPILSAIGVVAAASIVLRRRLLESATGSFGRVLAGPVLTTAAIVVSLGLLHLGQRARAKLPAPAPVPSAEVGKPPEPETKPAEKAPASAASAPVEAVQGGSIRGPRAPAEEVRAAAERGVDALLPLRERYPDDPAVLEPLVLALGGSTEGLPRAMGELDQLFRVAPERVADKTLGALVVKAALSPGEASTRALDVMGQRMGTLGADMLFDLMVTSVPLRQAARERLDDPKVKQQFTPALAIAFELRTAKTCEDRLPLLERAKQHGDARSVSVLIGLGSGAKRGCGPKKNKPCPPACVAEAARFKDAALNLQAKLNAKKR